MSKVVDKLTGKEARERAAADIAQAEEATKRQQLLESARRDEAASDVAKRKAIGLAGKRTGRRSLISTSNRGGVSNLGGAA